MYFQNPINEYDKITSVYLGAIIDEKFDLNELKEVFKNSSMHGFTYKDNKISNFAQFANFLGIKLKDK